MPCYDKKLEASRHEFEVPATAGGDEEPHKEVDLVLGTNEFAQALDDLLGGDNETIPSLAPPPTTEGSFNECSYLLSSFIGCLSGGAQIKNKEVSKVPPTYLTLEERPALMSGPSQRLLVAMKDKCPPESYFTNFRTAPRVEIINPSALKW
ncbi:unnamed protein product [Dibothriocephalus latus]|uniref:Iron hydrogenase large subunit C-terminal domain-containing protein n=1 Tax=Dibothriocephalus latus TaxID=60516 RepID=A0A3P6V1R9_DIBLA|nr:unnamed protein product [Dibothriocephalus latus]